MNYEAQLCNLADDDGDNDATVVIDLHRRVKPSISEAGTDLPLHWERHFWVNPGATSAPVNIAWKGEGRSATTQRIVLRRDSNSWRSSPRTWKSRLAALAMLSFLVSAVAAIALMTHA